jgi:hypothetical protein
MNTTSIDNSYKQTLYEIGENNVKGKDSTSTSMAVNSQDTYVPSSAETLYFTYTSSGVISEDASVSLENEILKKAFWLNYIQHNMAVSKQQSEVYKKMAEDEAKALETARRIARGEKSQAKMKKS